MAGDYVVTSATPGVNALYQLPPPPADFTGRAEELHALSENFGRGVQISGLQGQGGIGKTALALKFAEQLTPRYPDAQIYLDLRGAAEQQPLSASDALSYVLRAFHPTAQLPDDEAQLRALYLSTLRGKRALLLMDNARDDAQVQPLIPPAGCVLLVTSRWHFTLPGLYAKNLDALLPDDARDLLLTIADGIGDHADEIARLCGHLPLALRVTASTIAERRDLSPADYVRRLADERKRLELLDEVAASLSLSYKLLPDNLQQLWRALAVFPAPFDAAAAAAVWKTDAETTKDSLGELFKYSLLDWDDATARYNLHDLARLFADSRLSGNERYAAQARHAAHYANVLRAANKLYLQGGEAFMQGLALFDAEWTNIQSGQSWVARHASDDDMTARLCAHYPHVGTNLLGLRMNPRDRINWSETALSAARQSGIRSSEAALLIILGISFFELGEISRAIEFVEQGLLIYREIGDRHGEGVALGNLGIAYRNLGETCRAIELYEQQIEIAREVGDRLGEGTALGNLGIAYRRSGETRRAVELYEQALVIDREIGDRLGEAIDLWNLSLALDELGDRRQAIACAEASLKIRVEIEDPRANKVRETLKRWRGEKE